jgi:serine/threonine protein kinase
MDPAAKRAFYLGRYNCIERLGEGPLGETWRAKVYGVAGFEKQFAVKRLHAGQSQDEAFANAFVHAANVYAALDHERITRVHEVNVQGAQYYIAADLVRGIDLQRMLEALGQRGETLAADVAMLIALDVAEALAHAHERRDLQPEGVVHLGLSPRSILVTHEGEVRVTDVGLRIPLILPGWADGPEAAAWAGYTAPEVLRAGSRDLRADVFSLAAVLFELLTGRRAFEGATGAEVRQRIEGGPPTATATAPSTDARLQSLIAQAMQANPEFRLPSMDAFREQLAPLLGNRANRARADLASVARRVARPERKTGAFPVVAMPAMAPPPPPTPATPPTRWAPPPRGPQLTTPKPTNTMVGVGPDDAAILPVELVEVPGAPTIPQMEAVNQDEIPTRPIEKIEPDEPVRPPEKVAPAPALDAGWSIEGEREASKPAAELSGDAFGAALLAGAQAESHAVPAPPPPVEVAPPLDELPPSPSKIQPLPADPKRFPSLVAEDAKLETEDAGTIPPPPSAQLQANRPTVDSRPKPPPIPPPPPSHTLTVPTVTPPSTTVTPPTPPTATSKPVGHTNGTSTHATKDVFVPPPIELPPLPTPRPWLVLGSIVLGVAIVVGTGLYLASQTSRPATRTARPQLATPAEPTEPVNANVNASGNANANVNASGNANANVSAGGNVNTTPSSGAIPTPTPTTTVASSPTASANVDIATTPPGATLYIDGEPRGTSPARLSLPPGAHRVVALADGHHLRREQIKVGGALTQVNLTLDAAQLPSNIAGPAGIKVRCAHTHGELRILIDGEDTGKNCPNESRIAVQPGTHKIGLYSPRTDQTVEVEKEISGDEDHSTRVYLKY